MDFAEEEALVIGYGGNDYDSDTSPWEMGSDDESIDFDLLDDTDEDRKITRLTKNNTEFNSSNKNLLSEDDSSRRVKKEEEKLNSINNNVNNPVKTTDKAINILTYNDIQSTKTEKKLNQYFFPSSTEIKSFLNGHGIVEENGIKNNNERSQVTNNVKIQNCRREIEKKENPVSKIVLHDDFTPLNTRTYSFISELNKSNVSFEHSSDSDYSTCRHTPGDSTDSESFHDSEEPRMLPKSSFLHSTYSASSLPQMAEMDTDKKYDAGSSTSGDISNFSDDSDTHESNERTPYKARNTRVSATPSPAEKKPFCNDEHRVQPKPQLESLKANNTKQNHTENVPKERQSPPTAKQKYSAVTLDQTPEIKSNIAKSNNEESPRKTDSFSTPSGSPQNIKKESETPKAVTTPPVTSDTNTRTNEINRSPSSKNKAPVKNSLPEPDIQASTAKSSPELKKNAAPIHYSSKTEETEIKQDEDQTTKISGSNLTENDSSSKEQILRDKEFREYEDQSDNDKSPDAIINRQSKLAALALELELARRDSETKSGKSSNSPQLPPVSPPEVKTRYNLSNTPTISSPSENYPTIKKASAISCTSRLSTLPDVLQETPAKQKKTKFSLKKLLKRNKDSGTFSPANKEVNPKAWKKQTFDRNRLSLEIVHPMDLTSDVPTSADSTPTEEHKQIVSTNPGRITFKGVSSRARSLSALPQLSGYDQSGCALLECRKMDTVPGRKAGTVAERKKNRVSNFFI